LCRKSEKRIHATGSWRQDNRTEMLEANGPRGLRHLMPSEKA
jgi:hypothetical protein